MLARWLELIGFGLLVVALINFTLFCIVGVCIGGDALSGKVEDGHYYVSSHGKLTEVSPNVWHYSRCHAISVWITHPLAIFGGGGLISLSRRLKAAGKKARPAL
jgi:hypothetical protein